MTRAAAFLLFAVTFLLSVATSASEAAAVPRIADLASFTYDANEFRYDGLLDIAPDLPEVRVAGKSENGWPEPHGHSLWTPLRPTFEDVASGPPARFIDSGGTIIDRTSIRSAVNPHRRAKHVAGTPQYRGGGYFNSADDAQAVLDAFHDGSANILGVTRTNNIVAEVPSVTGFNNNPGSRFIDQPTSVFFIKGSSNPSVVPANPLWTAVS